MTNLCLQLKSSAPCISLSSMRSCETLAFLVIHIESFLLESSVDELDHSLTETEIYVVLPFYHWFRFSFLLFLCMLMCDNELETKKNKFETQRTT